MKDDPDVLINIFGGDTGTTTWSHFAVIKIGEEIGLYVNGNQVAYLSTFTTADFTGSLFIGQRGDASAWFDGKLDDLAIVNSNIFGATPNVGNTDTLNLLDTENPLNIVL